MQPCKVLRNVSTKKNNYDNSKLICCASFSYLTVNPRVNAHQILAFLYHVLQHIRLLDDEDLEIETIEEY